MLFGTMQVQNNELVIGGQTVSQLVKQHGSPLYVYDVAMMKSNLDAFVSTFQSDLFETKVAYASKAFLTKAMVRLLQEYDMNLDVVSAGELYTASSAGYPMNQIIVHGNNKSKEELSYYLDQQVRYIVIDNVDELKEVVSLAQEKQMFVHTLLRVNPGVEAHTHEYIITAKHTSKFGESVFDEAKIYDIMSVYQSQQLVSLDGFHCHIGSQVFDLASYQKTVDAMAVFMGGLEVQYNMTFHTLNLGGGFGVYYTEEDIDVHIPTITSTILSAVEEKVITNELHIKELMIEPGRSIVANTGTTLYTAGYTKKTYGGKTYLFVDGGMSDNIRPALYQASYQAFVATNMNGQPTEEYTIAGKLCESGDVLIKQVSLPEVSQNDIIAITSTGAYTYSMSSNYNRILKPAVVFVENGNSTVVVKRETFEDLIRNDL